MENFNQEISKAQQHLKECQDNARKQERIKIANEAQLEQLRTQEKEILEQVKSLGYHSIEELKEAIGDKMTLLNETLTLLDQLLRGEVVPTPLKEDLILPEFEPPVDDDSLFEVVECEDDDIFGAFYDDDDDFM